MKKKEIDATIYWSGNRIESYDSLWNFVIGPRGCGKTFDLKRRSIKKFLKTGERWVYLRRSEVELKECVKKFFDDLPEKFPDHEFRIWNNFLQLREKSKDEELDPGQWETMGYVAYLSGARIAKSIPYVNVGRIIFDEFIIPPRSRYKYLPDEVTTFLDFYESVSRLEDVQVFFSANALMRFNPYFVYFNIDIPYRKTIEKVREDIVIEMCDTPEYVQVKKNTRFGKLVRGTPYEKYAIDNDFCYDTVDYIEKKDKTYFYHYTLIIEDKKYGVYRSNEKGLIVISRDYDLKYPMKYNLTRENGEMNTMIVKNRRSYFMIHELIQMLELGNVRFESIQIKDHILPYLIRLI